MAEKAIRAGGTYRAIITRARNESRTRDTLFMTLLRAREPFFAALRAASDFAKGGEIGIWKVSFVQRGEAFLKWVGCIDDAWMFGL